MTTQEIIQGDCLEVMKGFADKSFDLVLTDPPYGIGYEGGFPNSDIFEAIKNDKVGDIDYEKLIAEMSRVAHRVIIFGANNFYQALPHKGTWLCWDKRCNSEADKLFGARFELAWIDDTNYGSGGNYIYRIQHAGAKNADGEGLKRVHPTQKPVELMRQILNDFSKESDTILDPFLGSGTTLVAAKQLNRNATGIEISKEYCAIAKSRLEQSVLL
jgi:DNA modification methylase